MLYLKSLSQHMKGRLSNQGQPGSPSPAVSDLPDNQALTRWLLGKLTSSVTLVPDVRQKLQSLASLWPGIMGTYDTPALNPESLPSVVFALRHSWATRQFTGTNTSHSPHGVWVRALLCTAICHPSGPLCLFVRVCSATVSITQTQGMACTGLQYVDCFLNE